MKKHSLYFVTGNKNKIKEASEILGDNILLVNNSLEIYIPDIEETGSSYLENACQKLIHAQKYLSIDCFSEDSGLEIEALNDKPGILSARYALNNKYSITNTELVMQQMRNKVNRRAKFVAFIALSFNKKNYFFHGQVQGIIAKEPSNSTCGFGYDPIFIPDGYDKTFADLPNIIKKSISHRAVALNKLNFFLGTQHPIDH